MTLKDTQLRYFDDIKSKPAEIEPADIKKQISKIKMEQINMRTSLTWKSVLFIVIVAISKAVLSIWFDEQTTNKFVEIIQQILNAIGLTAVGTAIWGIRRRIE